MKLVLLILATNICIHCSGQFSISGGMSRLKEGVFGEDNDTRPFGKQRLYNYNLYQIQFDYSKSPFRVFAQAGLLNSQFPLRIYNSFGTGGGSSAASSWTKTYTANLKFNYLVGKMGIGAVVISKKTDRCWGSFSYNMFGQIDYFLNSVESDHELNRTTTGWSLASMGYVTTVHPTDYSARQLISFEKTVFQYGMELQGRFGFQNYFFELSLSLALTDKNRAWFILNDSYQPGYKPGSLWNFNAGLRVGYLLKKRTKKQKNN